MAADENGTANTPVTRAEQIAELTDIDRTAVSCLRSAGLAIKALTGQKITAAASSDQDGDEAMKDDGDEPSRNLTAEESKTLFEQHNDEFITALQSIGARLRRQAYALEEAGINAAKAVVEDDKESQKSQQEQQNESNQSAQGMQGRAQRWMGHGAQESAQKGQEKAAPITNGGMGNLDVGWLNSRRDEVGRRKEVELWTEAKEMLEELEKERRQETGREDETMED